MKPHQQKYNELADAINLLLAMYPHCGYYNYCRGNYHEWCAYGTTPVMYDCVIEKLRQCGEPVSHLIQMHEEAKAAHRAWWLEKEKLMASARAKLTEEEQEAYETTR